MTSPWADAEQLVAVFEPAHLIDGALDPRGERFGVINPATGRAFAVCPAASLAQLDAAVAAARRAFPAWRDTPVLARRETLHRFARELESAAPRIAALLMLEQGKPLAQAEMEIKVSASHIKHLSELPLADEVLRHGDRGTVELRWHALGVVAGIAPWNFPVALGMHKVAQALYTGNTLILKPSPFTPLATLAVGALAKDIFPSGVLNVLAGDGELGAAMTALPGIDKISFTGSVATGKKVLQSAAATLKRVTLELGGNDPAVVLADADLDVAAAGIARSAFFNAGQICMAVKRVYVESSAHDALVERIAAKARALRVGSGVTPDVDMGPIQNRAQYEKVTALLREAVGRPGATVVTGGGTPDGPGYFVEPTVIVGLDDDAPLVAEEQFGPVLPILRVADAEEAIRRSNSTRLGLGASVWSANETTAAELAGRLEAGTVWINRHGVNESDVPFGGMKESGFGREHGVMGLHAYMEPQVVSRPPHRTG